MTEGGSTAGQDRRRGPLLRRRARPSRGARKIAVSYHWSVELVSDAHGPRRSRDVKSRYPGDTGGAIFDFSEAETGRITDCVLTGNAATGAFAFGGAILATSEAGVDLSGDVIRGNSAAYGGGVFSDAGGVTIASSTITGNHASAQGGACSPS